MNEELYRTSLAKYPVDRLPWLHSEVEPLRRFDLPRYRELPDKPRHNGWLGGHIRKALAGCRYAKPSADEFCRWFRSDAPLDEVRGYIVREHAVDPVRTGPNPLCGGPRLRAARPSTRLPDPCPARVSAWYRALDHRYRGQRHQTSGRSPPSASAPRLGVA